jgi:uncharacterized protein (DUF2336 family)
MRLTITLDDDLYAMARAHAVARRTSISKAIGELLRTRHTVGRLAGQIEDRTHPLSRFPISRGDSKPFSSEDVRRADEEEDLRHWSSEERPKRPSHE